VKARIAAAAGAGSLGNKQQQTIAHCSSKGVNISDFKVRCGMYGCAYDVMLTNSTSLRSLRWDFNSC
jgi:hypothetical protein